MSGKKEPGWGREKKEERIRRMKDDERIVREDFNDPFKFKPTRAPTPAPAAAGTAAGAGAAAAALAPPTRVQASPPPLVTPASLPLGGAATAQLSPPSTDSSDSDMSAAGLAPPPASMTTAASTPMNTRLETAVCIHACLVELHEHHGLKKSKPFGPKGAAILRSPMDNSFSLLLYAPITKKHEIELEINTKFSFTILPSLFATFSDHISKRYFSVQFKSQDDLESFSKHIALVKDFRGQVDARGGVPRRVITQDLTVGAAESRPAQAGDQVKLKYNVFLTADTHPMGIGRKIGSFEPKRFTLGAAAASAALLPPGVEEGLVGMKKKATRFMTVPPSTSEANVWGPHVPADATILVDVNVLSVRSPEEAKARGGRVRPPTGRTPTPGSTAPPDHPHHADDSSEGTPHHTSAPAPVATPTPTPAPVAATPTPAPVAHTPAPAPVAATLAATTPAAAAAAAASAPAPHPHHMYGAGGAGGYMGMVGGPMSGMGGMAIMHPGMVGAMPVMMSGHGGLMYSDMGMGAMSPHGMGARGGLMGSGGGGGGGAASGASASGGASGSIRERMRLLAQAGGMPPSTLAPVVQPTIEGGPSLASLLTELSLQEYIPVFAEQEIQFKDLLALGSEDLKELIPQMGPRRRILTRAHELAAFAGLTATSPHSSSTSAPAPSTSTPTASADKSTPVASARPEGVSATGTRAARAGSSVPAERPVVAAASTSSSHAEELKKEYERGQAETIAACKERIELIKNTAKTKFGEMEAQLTAVRAKHGEDVEAARNLIGKLRTELKAAQARVDQQAAELKAAGEERDRMRERSRQYVAQVQEREAKREQTGKVIKSAMEKVYTQITSSVKSNDVYDGTQIMDIVRRQIQAVTHSVLAAIEKETKEAAAATT